MKINEKDRSQLLRMAGNIACGLVTNCNIHQTQDIPRLSAKLAVATLQAIDDEIERAKE